jgi:hypothetical protein
MAGFRGTSDGVTARFARPEAAIIRDLVEQVVELIAEIPPSEANGAFDLMGLADEPAAGPASKGEPDEPDVPDADELAAMVGLGEAADPHQPQVPEDPVLARLLPDGYRDDPGAAQEFRRFTESGLRSAKVQAATTLLATLPPEGGKVKLSSEQAEAWLRSLNDVRLALGVRLGVTQEFDGLSGDDSSDDPRFAYIFVYQWLAELQDSLVSALS